MSSATTGAAFSAEAESRIAVTAFRSLPRGHLEIGGIVSESFQPRSVLSVVHLLRDARPIEGAGESEFQRGACWVFPIAEGGVA